MVAASEFEITGLPLDAINVRLVRLIEGGARVRALYPVHSAPEQQFREAIGAGDATTYPARP